MEFPAHFPADRIKMKLFYNLMALSRVEILYFRLTWSDFRHTEARLNTSYYALIALKSNHQIGHYVTFTNTHLMFVKDSCARADRYKRDATQVIYLMTGAVGIVRSKDSMFFGIAFFWEPLIILEKFHNYYGNYLCK